MIAALHFELASARNNDAAAALCDKRRCSIRATERRSGLNQVVRTSSCCRDKVADCAQ